ncbi:MAG TPA: hypothetical protein VGR32_04700 [Brevundimonas sp.]|jgi:hypothetical protein|uniref:hypothetical protein n=1 Tax=Brevundimonas sp. TaxID=1871086 RepID=UPI002DF5B866|nr:hypothetical protein [Brevundimonas sp.]
MKTVLALTALLLATPAAADPYDDFLELCVAPSGDVAAAQTKARAAGFGDAPAEVARTFRLPDFPDAVPLTRGEGAAMEIFIAGTAPREDFGAMTGTTCIVVAPALDAGSAETRLETKLGFPAFTDGAAGAPMWYLTGGPDVWRSEPQLVGSSDARIAEVARERPVSIFAVLPVGSGAGLMYGTLK